MFLLAVFFGGILHASGPGDDLKKMKEFYKDKKNLYLEFTMSLNFINYAEGNKEHGCVYMHCEKGSYSKVMEQTKINNERIFLMIDSHEKMAVVSNFVRDGKEITLNEMAKEVMDNLEDSVSVDDYYSLEYKENTPDKKSIVIKMKDNETWDYENMEIHLNQDYSLSEIVYNYKTEKNSQPQVKKVAIKYTKIDTKNNYEKLCSMEPYISIDQKKITAKEKLKGYRLIDNRIKD